MKLLITGMFVLLFGGLTAQALVHPTGAESYGGSPPFDMPEIRKESSLDVEVIEDWHRVEGEVPTRQKFITICVGELWPGQDYRIPVRMIVPTGSKAKGFHLTGGHMPRQLESDVELKPIEKELIAGGVGLVYTIVQDLAPMGQKELGDQMYKRFIKTLNPRYSIQYWGWPASIMRSVTAAYAEKIFSNQERWQFQAGQKTELLQALQLFAMSVSPLCMQVFPPSMILHCACAT